MSDLVITTPAPITPPVWKEFHDPGYLANRAAYEVARQAFCQSPPVQEIDPLTQANNKVLILEAKIRGLERELETERARNAGPVHQRNIEKR